jgi:diguanylate cyclase (GGDEF)-like protein/PAS domain S-box-containing protein
MVMNRFKGIITKLRRSIYYTKGPHKLTHGFFDNSLDGIYISTLEGHYVDVNNALVEMLGYSNKRELLSVNTRDLYFSPDDRPSPDERDRIFGTCLKRKDGTKIYAEISSRVLFEDGQPRYFEGIIRDKTEDKKYEERIKYLSFHDALTDLYNWAYFNEELKRLKKARILPITIIMADVDRLKYVNDTLGHRTGDKLLKKAADIFKDNFRSDDIIARTGGDEFCIILPGTSKKEALNIIERIRVKCGFESSDKLPISISFGAAEKNKGSVHLKNVLRDAEKSMYRDKHKRRQLNRVKVPN